MAGGAGWYGGGAGANGEPNSESGTGGGGSGFVWTITTSGNVPVGYLVPTTYYLTNASTIAGSQSMTNPNGGTMTGKTGNGYVRIVFVP